MLMFIQSGGFLLNDKRKQPISIFINDSLTVILNV